MKNLKLTVTPESVGARLDSFAASDESASLAMNQGTLKVKNGKIVVGDRA